MTPGRPRRARGTARGAPCEGHRARARVRQWGRAHFNLHPHLARYTPPVPPNLQNTMALLIQVMFAFLLACSSIALEARELQSTCTFEYGAGSASNGFTAQLYPGLGNCADWCCQNSQCAAYTIDSAQPPYQQCALYYYGNSVWPPTGNGGRWTSGRKISCSATPSPSSTPVSLTASPSASMSVSPSPGVTCPQSLFRPLPHSDLVGTFVTDEPLVVSTESACRIACCSALGCAGYAFAFTELRNGAASCFLLTNITATIPSSVMRSGVTVGIPPPHSVGNEMCSTSRVPPSATVSQPCPLRLFTSYDVIGSVLSSSIQTNEAACSSMCCSSSQCVGYSFFAGIVSVTVAAITGSASVLSDRTYYNGGQCGPGFIDVNGGRNCPLRMNDVQLGSSGSVNVPANTLTGAPCVLLSSVSELVPSSVMNGGIKLSALSNSES